MRTAKKVSRTCFWPAPEVTSAISVLARREEPLGGPADETLLLTLVKQAFGQRRKTVGRSLRDAAPDMDAVLKAAGIAPDARPEVVPVEAWAALARGVARQG